MLGVIQVKELKTVKIKAQKKMFTKKFFVDLFVGDVDCFWGFEP